MRREMSLFNYIVNRVVSFRHKKLEASTTFLSTLHSRKGAALDQAGEQ